MDEDKNPTEKPAPNNDPDLGQVWGWVKRFLSNCWSLRVYGEEVVKLPPKTKWMIRGGHLAVGVAIHVVLKGIPFVLGLIFF